MIRRLLKNKFPPRIEKLRISFFLFDSFKTIVRSAGYKINKQEVERLYRSERLPKVSLNDQFDMFYEKCLQNNIGSEFVYFFQTKMMTLDQQLLFAKEMRTRLAEQTQKNEEILFDFQTRLATLSEKEKNFILDKHKRYSLESMPGRLTQIISSQSRRLDKRRISFLNDRARIHQNYYVNKDQIDKEIEFTSKLIDKLEYNLFNGFRATVEFDLKRGKPSKENISASINLVTSKLNKISPYFDKWFNEMIASIIEDVNG